MDRINCFIILIGGGSASGKSTLANLLSNYLKKIEITSLIIPIDNYYRDLSHLPIEIRAKNNFDDPSAIEYRLLIFHLLELLKGNDIEAPIYDFTTHTRLNNLQALKPAQIIIVEGLHALCYEELRNIGNLKIYVDIPDDIRVIRRILRDIKERGRSIESIVEQYINTVKPMYEKYILPSKDYADIIIDGQNIAECLHLILSHPKLKNFIENLKA